MIQIGNNKIKGAFLGKDELKYIYIGKTCVYYKETPSTGDTSGIKVCFAVVDNVNTYKDRIYDTVYDRGSKSWYFLNNLGEYEKYGVVDEVSTLDKATRGKNPKSYSVNLTSHGSWVTSTTNPDSSNYDAYMSDGSHGVDSAFDIMVITLSTGFTEFDVYIRSYAESNYDYTVIGNLDSTIPTSNTDYSNSNVKTHTRGSQNSSTALSGYKKVSYTDIDPTKTHTIWVEYRKDSSYNANDDRGYVLIPKLPAYTIQGTTVYDGKLVALSSDKHEYKYTNGTWVDQGAITTTYIPKYYAKYDGSQVKFRGFKSPWNNGYKVVLDAHKTTGDALAICPSTDGSAPLEFVEYISEYYLDWHDPTSTTANTCTSESSKSSWGNSSYSSLNDHQILLSIAYGEVNATNLSDGSTLNSQNFGRTESMNYCTTGEYEWTLQLNNTGVTVHSVSFYDNNNNLLRNYVFDGTKFVDSITSKETTLTDGTFISEDLGVHKANYPTSYEELSAPVNILKFNSLDEANSYTGCLYPNEICTINDENYYAVRKKDDGSFSWEECPLSWKATYPSGKTVYVTGDTTIDKGDIKTDVVDVKIGNSVTSIGRQAFYSYTSLTSVMISNSVTSIGNRAFYSCTSLTSITLGNSVTSIGDSAFSDCKKLTNVTIPVSVTSLGNNAFYGCDSLTNIIIPSSVTSISNGTFGSCDSLTSITIPNSVTSLGNNAFDGCTSLASITIPNSVTSIGRYAFRSCTSLARIKVDDGNTMYDSRENCNAIIQTSQNTLITGCKNTVIPNSVTTIGDEAFRECESLTSITIPNSVTSIGRYAFYACTSLTSITLGNSVTSIGDSAFSDCKKLTNVTIPVSVTHLGAAFYGCDSLTNIIIPSSVTSISNGTFGSCDSLTQIKVDNGNTTYDSRNDCNAIIETKSNTLIAGCKSTVIPNSVTSIGKSAFAGLPSTDITIPNSVKSIGEYAFNGSSLTGITIPNSVTSIDRYAFDYCKSLKNVTIPSSITYITACLFQSCGSLSSITIPTSVATIGGNAFQGCGSLSSIMYQGTRSQWNSITKGDYMSYSPFRDITSNITVHCTDGNFKMTDDKGNI